MTVISSDSRTLLSTLTVAAAKLRDENHAAPRSKKDVAHTSILDRLTDTDPDRYTAFRDEQAQLKQTIAQLQSSRTEVNEQRKEAARQKIARIKAELQALHMMAAGDPKAAAKQAARLSRELSAAVKEYASASGGSGAATGVEQSVTATSTPANAAATTNDTAVTETSSGASSDTVQAKVLPPAPETAPAFDTEKIKTQGQPNQDDKDFISEAKTLAKRLKNIIEGLRQKLHAHDGADDLRAADKALGATAQSLNDIGANAQSASAPNIFLNITA